MQLNSDYNSLQEKLKVKINSLSLLEEAFRHKSFVNETNDDNILSNERLEFLGDAVLELVVTEALFKQFPEKEEGELTALRSALVRGRNLSHVAKDLQIGEYLILSKGEFNSKGQEKDYILANLVEAVIGAIFLDQGFTVASDFIMNNIYSKLPQILEEHSYIDSKTKFQEVAQDKISVTPTYNLISASGPDHSKVFKMGVYINDELVGEGEGSSKQKAEQAAAHSALQNKGWI